MSSSLLLVLSQFLLNRLRLFFDCTGSSVLILISVIFTKGTSSVNLSSKSTGYRPVSSLKRAYMLFVSGLFLAYIFSRLNRLIKSFFVRQEDELPLLFDFLKEHR